MNRVRFFIADVLVRLFPKSCWADLATWAMGLIPLNECDFTGRCMRDEYQVQGACYCGKFINRKESEHA